MNFELCTFLFSVYLLLMVIKVKKKITHENYTLKISITTDTWGQNGFTQGNRNVEKMLDVIVKIAKRSEALWEGLKHFGSPLTLTTSVAAGLSLYHRALVNYSAADAPALPLLLHLWLELLFCTAGSEHHHGEYFQWASGAHLSSRSSLCWQNHQQLFGADFSGPRRFGSLHPGSE